MKLDHILRKNRLLLCKYLFILHDRFSLSKRLSSVYKKLAKLNKLSSRLIKKVCSALLTRKLIEKAWLSKPSLDVLVNLANSGPMLNIRVHNLLTTCVLDTGSTYTLVPFNIWQKFKINANQLNTSVQFNINSASHSNKDAVLGQIKLDLSICNIDGNEQLVTQNCLILRPNLELQFVLLGNDFLYDNSVNISYSRSKVQPLISIYSKKVE